MNPTKEEAKAKKPSTLEGDTDRTMEATAASRAAVEATLEAFRDFAQGV